MGKTVKERWAPIPGFPGYEVSTHGRIISRKYRNAYFMSTQYNKGRYHRVLLRDCNKRRVYFLVHRLVLLVFKGKCPRNMEGMHLDGDRENNCITNLAYGTRKENASHLAVHGTLLYGSKHNMAKLTEQDIPGIRRAVAEGLSLSSVAERFNVCKGTIWLVVHRKCWAHVV